MLVRDDHNGIPQFQDIVAAGNDGALSADNAGNQKALFDLQIL